MTQISWEHVPESDHYVVHVSLSTRAFDFNVVAADAEDSELSLKDFIWLAAFNKVQEYDQQNHSSN